MLQDLLAKRIAKAENKRSVGKRISRVWGPGVQVLGSPSLFTHNGSIQGGNQKSWLQ